MKVIVEPYNLKMGVTQSMLQDFDGCRVSARNGLDTWESLISNKRALNYGSMWHLLLQRFTEQILIPEKSKKGKIAAVLKSFALEWTAKQLKELAEPEHTEEDLAHAEIIYPYYVDTYIEKDLKKKWIGAEPVFDV